MLDRWGKLIVLVVGIATLIACLWLASVASAEIGLVGLANTVATDSHTAEPAIQDQWPMNMVLSVLGGLLALLNTVVGVLVTSVRRSLASMETSIVEIKQSVAVQTERLSGHMNAEETYHRASEQRLQDHLKQDEKWQENIARSLDRIHDRKE